MKFMKTYKIQTLNRNVFWTGDQHYFHRRFVESKKRPAGIDALMISNHNSVVHPKDIVIHNGDVSLGNKDQTIQLFKELKGHHIVVPGDHDRILEQLSGSNLFDLRPPIFKTKVGDHQIINCHYLMTVWARSHYNSWHTHAHVHGHLSGIGKTYDVGVENNNFYPIPLDELIRIMEKRPNNLNYIIPEARNQWTKK